MHLLCPKKIVEFKRIEVRLYFMTRDQFVGAAIVKAQCLLKKFFVLDE